MKSKYLVLLACTVLLMAGTACSNTFDGLGRDMEVTGQKIQNTF